MSKLHEIPEEPEILQAVRVSTMQLRPNTYNPNQQTVADFEMLVESMKQFGFTVPVLVNDGSIVPALKDMIIDGEHRWRAAQVLNMDTVPVVYKGVDEAGMRVSTLRHNEARGHHDMLMEADLIRDLAQSGEISTSDLSAMLHIDPVELDVMLEKSKDFLAVEEASQILQAEHLEQLAEQGVTGQQAQDIARRHAIIAQPGMQKQENGQQLAREANTNVKVELVFTDEQYERVATGLRQYDNSKSFIYNVCKWWTEQEH